MGTSVRRLALALSLLAILTLGVFGGVSSALGLTVTGPATFSARTPADASSVGVVRPPISVKAYDVKGLAGSPYYSMKVDGVNQIPAFSRTDANNVTLSFTPKVDLANGTHTVYASVKNNSGVYSTTTWSFTVSRAPLPSAPSPVPGSTVTNTSPTLSVTVGGTTTGLTSLVLVDGTSVPATFDSGTGVLSAPTSGLANDASHDVTVTVTNSAGSSATLAWSFSVQIYAPMPTPASGCVSCHPGFPDAHPMDDCPACHGPGSPVGENWNTPDYGPHSASYVAQTPDSCVTCHTSGYATVPPLHSMTSGTTSHDSAGACSPCHVRSLTIEHYRYGKDCFTCHASPDPLVAGAIATGRTDCEACHPNASAHVLVHQTPVLESCAGADCHSGSGLTDVHTGTCDSCHESTDPRVVAAIAGGVKTCDACHSAESHEAQHAAAVTPSCAGAGCHAGTSLTSVHINAGTTLTCASCHSSTDPEVVAAIAGHDKSCTACHDGAGHGPAHDTTVNASCTGAGCHAGTNLTTIHTTETCASCHSSAAPKVVAAIASHDTDCVACHDAATAHGDLSVKHTSSGGSAWVQVHGKMYDWAEEGGADANCSECHVTSLLSVHANYCPACHGSSAPVAVKTAVAAGDTDCTSCHPDQHVYSGSHGWLDWEDGCQPCHGTQSCSDCHSAEQPVWAPVTTSNAAASYVGAASINLSAVDSGSSSFGIQETYYSLDGAPAVAGTQVNVPAPGSGTSSHTLSFWSTDWSGHTETANTVLFTVSFDSYAPVTSSDVVSDKDYANDQTFTLTAADDSAVTGTWWQLDGTNGSWTSGSAVTVTAPTSSTVHHTLYFYSRDANGNSEAPKSVAFTMTPGQDFTFTGANQTYVVPSGVTTIGVVMTGGSGGSSGSTSGGRGGRVQSVLSVTPGSTLTLKVGGTPAGGPGGWPNGGNGSYALGTGGGGSSSLWFGSAELAEAGGGGGAGYLGAGGTGGTQGTLPGGFKTGASAPLYSAGGGGGGWNAGSAGTGSPVYTGGTGGTSYIVSGSGTTYAAGSNTGNGSISIRFTAPGPGPFTLNYTAGSGGAITGTSLQTVAKYASGTAITAVANSGYHFVNWSDGVATATRTDANVTANISATANFAINTYTLTYTAGSGGTLTGTSSQTINHGASGTAVTAVANSGYHFVNWSDGVATATRTEPNVTANKAVTANFAVNTYTLTYTAGSGGTLTGTSSQTVNHGASGTAVTAVANSGYHFVNWSDGVATATRTETNVTANKSVAANFAADIVVNYTLTYTAGSGGTISGASPQTVASGGSGSAVSAAPNAGYHFLKWSDDSVANPRTDANVTANLNLTATFEADAPAGGNPVIFTASGADQPFTVPAGVTALSIDLFGSQGGNSGGAGGRVQATVPVTPGQVLTVRVGDQGGWPNGGAGTPWGGAGGGSTSILSGSTILAEAGGGGGSAGGSPNQAGPGGYAGTDPGGNAWGDDAWQDGWGAGGGGGWNGGGNGGGDDTSGDGGTSRVPSIPSAILTPGVQAGNGLAIIGW